MTFTAAVEKGENGWLVGQVIEIPAAMSQGKTLKSLKLNLIDALRLVLQTKRSVKIDFTI